MILNLLRTRPALNTAIGVLLAVVAGVLLLGYLSSAIKGGSGGPLARVPVARRDIEMGQTVQRAFISYKSVPRDYVVPGSLRSESDIVGRRSVRFIGKGEPFTGSSISGGASSLTSRIPPDLRAYALQLGKCSGAGTEVRPGDQVDVLAASGEVGQARTILRNRTVVSVGSGMSAGSEGEEDSLRITLLVSPQEAELIAHAECVGAISISLCPVSGAGN